MERIENVDSELVVLETIHLTEIQGDSQISQRELAEKAGVSLGMTNMLIRQFVEKGWVLIKKINSRNITYAMTPDGVNEIARRTYRYFKRTARIIALYRELIETYIIKIKTAGFTTFVLAGSSELDFVFEYACERHNIIFVKSTNAEKAKCLSSKTTIVVFALPHQDKEYVSIEDIISGL